VKNQPLRYSVPCGSGVSLASLEGSRRGRLFTRLCDASIGGVSSAAWPRTDPAHLDWAYAAWWPCSRTTAWVCD